MLNDIKLALRLTTNIFDEEIETYAEYVVDMLRRLGVDESKISFHDANVKTLVIAYCKYQLDFQGNGERWRGIYEQMLRSFITDTRYK